MIRHLKALGADHGLIIDAPILELLGINEHTPLHISTDGEALIIRPVRSPALPDPAAEEARAAEHRVRLQAIAERLMDQHADTFRKLAQ